MATWLGNLVEWNFLQRCVVLVEVFCIIFKCKKKKYVAFKIKSYVSVSITYVQFHRVGYILEQYVPHMIREEGAHADCSSLIIILHAVSFS